MSVNDVRPKSPDDPQQRSRSGWEATPFVEAGRREDLDAIGSENIIETSRAEAEADLVAEPGLRAGEIHGGMRHPVELQRVVADMENSHANILRRDSAGEDDADRPPFDGKRRLSFHSDYCKLY
jgi:hypothetical protein